RPACIRWTSRVRSPAETPMSLPRRQTSSTVRPTRASRGGSAVLTAAGCHTRTASTRRPAVAARSPSARAWSSGSSGTGPPRDDRYTRRDARLRGLFLMRVEELAKTLDHTVLGPRATTADVERACGEALDHH